MVPPAPGDSVNKYWAESGTVTACRGAPQGTATVWVPEPVYCVPAAPGWAAGAPMVCCVPGSQLKLAGVMTCWPSTITCSPAGLVVTVQHRDGQLAQAMIGRIGDQHLAVAGGQHRRRLVQRVGGGGAAVSVVAARSGAVCRGAEAGDGGDDAVGADLADGVVAAIGDVDVAGGIFGQSERAAEFGGSGRAAVAAESGPVASGDGLNGAVLVQAEHAVVAGVGKQHRAAGLHGDAAGRGDVFAGAQSGAALIAAAAGHGFDGAAGDFADPLVAGIGDPQIAAGVDGH